MSENFEGEIPEIEIYQDYNTSYHDFLCKKNKRRLDKSCRFWWDGNPPEECCSCLGYNKEFCDLFNENKLCSNGCGTYVDFGYFIFIYLLEKAGLLPIDYEMICCFCANREEIINARRI